MYIKKKLRMERNLKGQRSIGILHWKDENVGMDQLYWSQLRWL